MNNQWFQNIVDSIAVRGRELLGLDNDELTEQNIFSLCQQLLAGRGEASGIALSQEILRLYEDMTKEEKLEFFQLLATEFEPDLKVMQTAMEHYQQSRSADNLMALNNAVEAPRQELFRRLNFAPHGTASLVALRADLLRVLKANPNLKSVDSDLKHLLTSWFNRGFLQLRSIDWQSPAHILEKIINYESVHAIQGWNDLRRRLMKDRRCFAFFHHAIPDEPLIFIEVAFVQGLSNEVMSLIDPAAPMLDPAQADTAIFYSINNTQVGLRGISFGNFLIKQVLTELTHEFPRVKLSSTLSPLPGFAASVQSWLNAETENSEESVFDKVIQRHSAALKELATQYAIDNTQLDKTILKALLENHLGEKDKVLSVILSELALMYLTQPVENGKLIDPVAMFHLSNGARLERLNSYADMSPHGLSSSYSVMANYLYDLNAVESNHEAFASKGKVMMSDELLKQFKQFNK